MLFYYFFLFLIKLFIQTGCCLTENYQEELYINILPNHDLFSFFNFTIESEFKTGKIYFFVKFYKENRY